MLSADQQRPTPLQLRKLLQVYSNALRSNPGDLVMRTKLAEVLRLLNRNDEAIAIYSGVAWAYGVSGNLGQAIMLCKLILDLAPEHKATQEMLAKLFVSKQIRDRKQSVAVVKVGGQWIADPRGGQASGPSLGSSQTPSAAERPDPHEPLSHVFDSLPELHAPAPNADHVEEHTAAELPSRRRRRSGPAPRSLANPQDREELPFPDVPADPAPRGLSELTLLPAPDERSVVASLEGMLEPLPALESRPAVKLPAPPHPVSSLASVPVPLPTNLPSPSGLERTRVEMPPKPPSATALPTDATGRPVLDPLLASSMRPEDERATRQLPRARRDGPSRPVGSVEVRAKAPAPPLDETHEVPLVAAKRADPPLPDPLADPPRFIDRDRPSSDPPTRVDPSLGREDTTISADPPEAAPSAGAPFASVDELALEHAEQTSLDDPPPVPADPDDPPAARPRGGTQPGYVITGSIEPASLKYLKTTRRYATVQRPLEADDVPAPSREPLTTTAPRPTTAPLPVAEPPRQTTTPLPVIADPPRPTPAPLPIAAAPPEAPRFPTAPLPAVSQPPATPPRGPSPSRPTVRMFSGQVAGLLRAGDGSPLTTPPRPGARPTIKMDVGQMSSLLRVDAETAFADRPAAINFMSIQREVNAAGHDQQETAPSREEEEEAERNLRDTLREPPAILGISSAGDVEDSPYVPFPIFSELDTPAFLAMVERLERRVYAQGAVVFQEGDPGDSLYLVSSGNLQVLKSDESGQIQLARLSGGSFFGEFGLLTDGRRHATVRCIEDSELLVLRREVLIELTQSHPSISWTLRTFYQQRVMANVMATSPLFRAVSPEDRRAVLSRFTFRRFLEGETIVEEGHQGTGFHVILVGEVLVTCRTEEDPEFALGALSEGHYFGEMSLLSGCVAEATVTATRVTEVLMLNAQDFYELAAAHPEVWVEVQQEADRRRQATADRLASHGLRATDDLCLI
jgi:CRP-like cAMP-binding protein